MIVVNVIIEFFFRTLGRFLCYIVIFEVSFLSDWQSRIKEKDRRNGWKDEG